MERYHARPETPPIIEMERAGLVGWFNRLTLLQAFVMPIIFAGAFIITVLAVGAIVIALSPPQP